MGAYTWREESESCILSPTTCLPISRVRGAGSFLGLMFSASPKTPRSSGKSQSSRTGSTGPGQREAGAISKSLLPLGPGPPCPAGLSLRFLVPLALRGNCLWGHLGWKVDLQIWCRGRDFLLYLPFFLLSQPRGEQRKRLLLSLWGEKGQLGVGECLSPFHFLLISKHNMDCGTQGLRTSPWEPSWSFPRQDPSTGILLWALCCPYPKDGGFSDNPVERRDCPTGAEGPLFLFRTFYRSQTQRDKLSLQSLLPCHSGLVCPALWKERCFQAR